VDLAPRVAAAAEVRPWSGERSGPVLGMQAGAGIARHCGVSPREVDEAALAQGVWPERYLRNQAAYSREEQLRLLASRAALVGLGGLGGHVLEILARAGVGHLRVCDGDRFEATNLNRQLLCAESLLGCAKARAAQERVKTVNSTLSLEAREAFLWDKDMPDFLDGADLAVDCLGGLAHRRALQRAAGTVGLPLVTAAVAGFTLYVATVLPGAAGPADFLGGAGQASGEDLLGCPPEGVALAAALQAAECLRILAGQGPGLAGRMLAVDLRALSFDLLSLG
jgi:molybdopterin/thiamine biosynthesis adenylyltransferase